MKEIDNLANPAPLGLMGFGLTTVLLNLHNVGFYGLGSMILALGIFYGGIAQVMVGVMEWKKGNTFGTTAFTSYGFFWLSLVGLLIIPELGWGGEPHSSAMISFFFMWGLFTAVLFIGTLRMNKSLQFVFGSLTVLFFLLTLAELSGLDMVWKTAGIVGIVCGFSAIYTGLGQVLNEVYGKNVVRL